MAVIGVDIGGTKISAALFDNRGNMVSKEVKLLAGRTGNAAGELAGEIVSEIVRKYGYDEIEGIGLCVPGIAYSKNDTVWAPNIPGWEHFPLKSTIQKYTGEKIPINIDSDRTCYILGEVWMGAAKGCTDAIYLAVGTGIGAGILIDGHVLHGKSDIVGATGWMALEPPHKEEYLSVGCFEYYASGNGIATQARNAVKKATKYNGILSQKPVEEVLCQDLFEAYRQNDPIAIEVIDKAIQMWGMGSANLVSLFNPDKIIFGGGVFGPASEFIERIYAEACKWGQPISMKEVTFCATTVKDNAALLGAAYLAINNK